MAVAMDATRRDLHLLIDRLPADRAAALLRGLRERDPMLIAIALAPEDDEPATDEERAAVAEAMEDVRAGRLLRWEDVRDEWLRP